MLEFLLRQPSVGRLQTSLHRLGLRRNVHEVLVGDEGERAIAVADHPVGYRHGPDAGEEKCGLVRAEDADLESPRASWQGVARSERASLELRNKLIEPGAVAPDGAAKSGNKLSAVPKVQPVGEEDVLWRPMPLQPLEPAGRRQQRVDEDALSGKVIRADADVNLRMHRRPVKQPADDLLGKCHASPSSTHSHTTPSKRISNQSFVGNLKKVPG